MLNELGESCSARKFRIIFSFLRNPPVYGRRVSPIRELSTGWNVIVKSKRLADQLNIYLTLDII